TLYLKYEWALGSPVVQSIGLQTGRPGFDARCHQIPSEFTCRNCGGGDRGRVAIYRPFGEVSLSLNRTVHLYGAQGQRQAYL
ncbi:hypothetical protein TNCV_3062701, partial [Trichonephila clavipes]